MRSIRESAGIMESMIKSVIMRHLAIFLEGLRRDQISLSLLSGKGALRDVHVNCDEINRRLEAIQGVRRN